MKLIKLFPIKIFALALLLPLNVKSQINSSKDEVFYKQLIASAFKAITSNPDSAERIINQHQLYFETTTDKSLKASYFHFLGVANQMRSSVKVSLSNYIEAQKLYADVNDSVSLNRVRSGIGACYMVMSQYLQAKHYLTKSLKYAESVKDSNNIANSCINLSFIHFDNNEYSIAEGYLSKALAFSKTDVQRGRATNNLGEVYIKRNQLNQALSTFKKGLSFSVKANDQLTISMILSNIGYVKLLQKQTDSAFYYLNRVVVRNKSFVEDYLLAQTYVHLANLELVRGRNSLAKEYINKALNIANANNMSRIIADSYSWLSVYYSNSLDFKKALSFKNKAVNINDSLFNEAKSRQIGELEAIYQSEAKQVKINLLNAQNTANQLRLRNSTLIITFLSVIAVVILIFSMVLFYQHKQKARVKSQILEQKLLRSQMNPHFIFNSLVSIQSILNKQPPEVVSGHIGKFSRLIRLILENSRCNLICIEREVETLELYIEMQRIRFADNFTYSIELPDDPEFLEFEIPPMITQPFVENAIEHGFLRSSVGGHLSIRFRMENSYICCDVEDNGVGIKQASAGSSEKEHKSLAMDITRERLALISKNSRLKASFTIEDLSALGRMGTLVKMKIPIQVKV